MLTSTDMPKAYHDDYGPDCGRSRIGVQSFPIQNSKSLMRRMFAKEFDRSGRRICSGSTTTTACR